MTGLKVFIVFVSSSSNFCNRIWSGICFNEASASDIEDKLLSDATCVWPEFNIQ